MRYLMMVVCVMGGLGLMGCRDYIDLADEDQVHGVDFSMSSDEGAGVGVMVAGDGVRVGEKM